MKKTTKKTAKKTAKKVTKRAAPIEQVIYKAHCLPVEDPIRVAIVKRLKQELAECAGSVTTLAEWWGVTPRQAQRAVRPYRESGEIVDKLTIGQKIKKALAERAKGGK